MSELRHLAAVLAYSRGFVKKTACMGMTNEGNVTWAIMTPHPVTYMEYLDLVYQIRHKLEDTSNFSDQVEKEEHCSKRRKRGNRHTSERKQKTERKG